MSASSEAAVAFTTDEIEAARETKTLLKSMKLASGAAVPLSDREIMLCTMVCKLRPEGASKKYVQLLDAMSVFGITSFEDVFSEINTDEKLIPFMKEAVAMVYPPCGTDKEGRGVMWIKSQTKAIPIGQEKLAIVSVMVYYVACHSDLHTLRSGISFVIDTLLQDYSSTSGNEANLQKVFRSLPLRPQNVFILSSNYLKRLALNFLLGVAAAVTSEKVLSRIKFVVAIEDVEAEIDKRAIPVYFGGGGGGFETDDAYAMWLTHRFKNFPLIPDL